MQDLMPEYSPLLEAVEFDWDQTKSAASWKPLSYPNFLSSKPLRWTVTLRGSSALCEADKTARRLEPSGRPGGFNGRLLDIPECFP